MSSRAAAVPCVVVADDNEDLLALMTMALAAAGFEVYGAADGTAAVALADRHRPALMILDIDMPTCDGYEAAREIRSASWGSKIVLVAHTGRGTQEDVLAAADAGFDRHVPKPVPMAELIEIVEDCCA